MHNHFVGVSLAALLAAAGTAAQGDIRGDRIVAPIPGPIFHGGAAGGVGSTIESDRPLVRFRNIDLGTGSQDPDYSLAAMFQQSHGDFLGKRQRFDPRIEFRGQLMPNQSVDGEAGKFELLRGVADIEVPIMVAPDAYLLFGAIADVRRNQYQNMVMSPPGISLGDENLYQLGVKFGFGTFINSDLLLEATIVPSVFSDLDGTTHHQDYDYPTEVLFTWRTNEDFFFKGGIRYNEIFDEAKVLPYLGFSYTPMPEWRIDVLLPEMIEASYWPDPGMGFLFGVEIQGAQYRVRTSSATGRQQDDLQVQEIFPYLGVMMRSSDNIAFFGRVGVVVAGDYKLTDGTTGANMIDGTLEPGFFLEVGMGFDF